MSKIKDFEIMCNEFIFDFNNKDYVYELEKENKKLKKENKELRDEIKKLKKQKLT